ncbi:SWI/SNF-related matrix-associated actin-dependent regulator of chromatin subfamily A-like protein 1 [Anabrus simplex]|uniref:SWI/SNF-related matrix-associated actin-dependent regulator of chromatin subfamily A-like protein 1 n=1 Tax=Anabrus simplex TaxID=316456 RepID=UPI0035A32FF0
MSNLTKEQLERIEANRQRALEKKAERLKGSTLLQQVVAPPICQNVKLSATQGASGKFNAQQSSSVATKQKSQPLFDLTGSDEPNPGSSRKFNGQQSSDSAVKQKHQPLFNLNGSEPPKRSYSVFRKVLTGCCRLVSPQRFMVDVGYHQEMINLLKTIKSAQYDPKEKRWTFLVEDHKAVMNALRSLKDEVSVSPLPRMILEVLAKSSKEREPSSIDLSRIDPVLLDHLMPFQREGVCFGVSKGGRCLIADDMGLGKTIEALGIAHYYVDDWPMLIVCPSSVRFLWSEAIQTWLPSVPLHSVMVLTCSKDPIEEDTRVLITSYDLLSRASSAISKLSFGVIVLDESHFIKSKDSARTKAATAICQKARRVLLLSGTPALSRPIELFTQLRIIDPKAFRGSGSMQEYGLRYCAAKQNAWGWDYSGSSNMEELQLLLECRFMIRRLKSDVITQLPAKMRQVVVLNPSSVTSGTKQMKHFEKELQNKKASEMRGALLAYYRITGQAKLAAIQDYVSDLLEGDRKFLCFAHHQLVMDGICEVVNKKNLGYIRIDGSTSSSGRKQLCDRFQFDDSCMVAVLSITAANTGITLTAAQLVVFAELFWNPGVLTQAEDRAHRIGQQDSVLVQYLVAQGTADDHLWPLIQHKLDVLNKAGLSKDNFRRSDTTSVMQTNQKTLLNYFSTLNEVEEDEMLALLLDET